MPTVSPRLEVMKALTTLLQGITPANGFDFDLSSSVFRGRMTFGEDDPLPMVSLLEAPNPKPGISSEGNRQFLNPWEIIIQGFMQDDFNNPTDSAYVLMEEVKTKLRETKADQDGYNILGLPKVVTKMNIGSGVVRPPDEASNKAYFWLVLTLEILD